jgi:hypothetical protein
MDGFSGLIMAAICGGQYQKSVSEAKRLVKPHAYSRETSTPYMREHPGNLSATFGLLDVGLSPEKLGGTTSRMGKRFKDDCMPWLTLNPRRTAKLNGFL